MRRSNSRKKIRFGKYKISEDMLCDSIVRVMSAKESKEDAEVAQTEPYVFSDSFDKSMEKILRGEIPKNKVRYTVRYIAATIVMVLLVGGLIFIGNEDARASRVGIGIQEWLENSFIVENKAEKNSPGDVLFEESQIGYLPDGFEKVEEDVRFSYVIYKYQNDASDYIIIRVWRDKVEAGIDNNEIGQVIGMNAVGMEYRFVDKEETEENTLTWMDAEDALYAINSTLDKEEMLKIMDSISY